MSDSVDVGGLVVDVTALDAQNAAVVSEANVFFVGCDGTSRRATAAAPSVDTTSALRIFAGVVIDGTPARALLVSTDAKLTLVTPPS